MSGLPGIIEDFSGKNGQGLPDIGYNQAFHELFNFFVGAGKRFSIKEIAIAGGFSVDTVNNWSQGISAPNFDNLVTLCRIMPLEFKSRFINMLGGNDIVPAVRRDCAEDLEVVIGKWKRGEI